jgi:aspartate-semialdehyde dehydrogenase
MTSTSKPVLSSADLRGTNHFRVAIVGAASLKGKEIAEILKDRNFPAIDVRLLDDDEALGRLEALGDEMSFIQSVRAEQFERVDFTFFASDQHSTRSNWKTARDLGSTIIDLSFALEDDPSATIRSPWIEKPSGPNVMPELQPGPVVVAHPAATVLALIAMRAGKAGTVRNLISTVFEPASERGQKGMDELHEQTVNLLSFQELPKEVFDAQIAFNTLSRYGPRAELPLDVVANRILAHYRRVAPGLLAPAISLVQAPIFHGYSFSIYVELEQPVSADDFSKALEGEHVTIVPRASDPASNVSAAGQNDIVISITRDANHENGIWLWVVADNLRITALTAVECAEAMTASRPRGQIQ